jgi:hypothetical protein
VPAIHTLHRARTGHGVMSLMQQNNLFVGLVGLALFVPFVAAVAALTLGIGVALYAGLGWQFLGFHGVTAAANTADWCVTHALNGSLFLLVTGYTANAVWSLVILVQAFKHAPTGVPLRQALYAADNPYRLSYALEPGESIQDDEWYTVTPDGKRAIRNPLLWFEMMTTLLLYVALYFGLSALMPPLGGALGLTTAKMAGLNLTNCSASESYSAVVAQCWATPRNCHCGSLASVSVALVGIILCCAAWVCFGKPGQKRVSDEKQAV